MRARLAPFLVLLEARYAPLLFAVAPQSYAVYLWLWMGSDQASASFWFAVMGALGYELVYVGAIAWAEEGRSSFWTWATAGVALIFSVVVAFYVYRSQGAWAWLHAGFPLVAFTYTLNMHSKRPVASAQTALETLPERSKTTEAPESGSAVAAPFQALPQALPLTVVLNNNPPASAPLETVVIEEAHRYHCPHCGEALTSKQAVGAAVKNGYCLQCKKDRRAA